MRLVVQRVSRAAVRSDGVTLGEIGSGAVVLVGVAGDDTDDVVDRMADKLVGLRYFTDADGRTNVAIGDVGGALLVVSQFTLYADVRRGRRTGSTTPGFASRPAGSAPPWSWSSSTMGPSRSSSTPSATSARGRADRVLERHGPRQQGSVRREASELLGGAPAGGAGAHADRLAVALDHHRLQVGKPAGEGPLAVHADRLRVPARHRPPAADVAHTSHGRSPVTKQPARTICVAGASGRVAR